jgi:hypothetical protein
MRLLSLCAGVRGSHRERQVDFSVTEGTHTRTHVHGVRELVPMLLVLGKPSSRRLLVRHREFEVGLSLLHRESGFGTVGTVVSH